MLSVCVRPAVFQEQSHRVAKALQCLFLSLALTIGPGNLRTVRDKPWSVALYDRGGFIVHQEVNSGGQTTTAVGSFLFSGAIGRPVKFPLTNATAFANFHRIPRVWG